MVGGRGDQGDVKKRLINKKSDAGVIYFKSKRWDENIILLWIPDS